MSTQKVLVIGGYGAVGSQISTLLVGFDNPGVGVVLGGRDVEKAKRHAGTLGAESCFVDVDNQESVRKAIEDVDIVVNCCVGIRPHLNVVDACLQRQRVVYLDLAGVPLNYYKSILDCHDRAVEAEATLVTGLGVNPGIPGIVLADNPYHFDVVEDVDVYFTLGAKLEGLSLMSLEGVGEMVKAQPLAWKDGRWQQPEQKSRTMFVQRPFHKKIYFGRGAVTGDLIHLPFLKSTQNINMWSGMESAFQGMMFILGIRMGLTRSRWWASQFLRFLRFLGRSDRYTNDAHLKIEITGTRDGRNKKRVVQLMAAEEMLTAVAAAIVVQQVLDGKVTQRGAFLPPHIVSVSEFVDRLKDFDIGFWEEWSGR